MPFDSTNGYNADDVQAEHNTAMRSLNTSQRMALDRIAQARRLSTFNHLRADENLVTLFSQEAEKRNEERKVAV